MLNVLHYNILIAPVLSRPPILSNNIDHNLDE